MGCHRAYLPSRPGCTHSLYQSNDLIPVLRYPIKGIYKCGNTLVRRKFCRFFDKLSELLRKSLNSLRKLTVFHRLGKISYLPCSRLYSRFKRLFEIIIKINTKPLKRRLHFRNFTGKIILHSFRSVHQSPVTVIQRFRKSIIFPVETVHHSLQSGYLSLAAKHSFKVVSLFVRSSRKRTAHLFQHFGHILHLSVLIVKRKTKRIHSRRRFCSAAKHINKNGI